MVKDKKVKCIECTNLEKGDSYKSYCEWYSAYIVNTEINKRLECSGYKKKK